MSKVLIKTKKQQADLRESGSILAEVHELLIAHAIPGMTGIELNKLAHDYVKKRKVGAPFLGYGGFPGVVCISINATVIHGIPNSYVLKGGDLVSFDFGINYNGMITDSARTMIVGGHTYASREVREFVATARQALDAGIAMAIPGNYTGDIGLAVDTVIRAKGYGNVQEFCGHGVGCYLHEEPEIPNYGRPKKGVLLKAGMTIAIEPMLLMGGRDKVYIDKNGWDVVSADGSLTAHEEDTIIVSDTGPIIITRSRI